MLISHIMITRSLFWTLHIVALLIASFWIAWWMLTPVNFGYRIGYHLLHINLHISEFAPQNLYKRGYENTTDAERFDHFEAIVNSINHGGTGLESITYTKSPSAAERLLTDAEVTHLKDVSALVEQFQEAGPIALIIWLSTFLWAKFRRYQLPSTSRMSMGGAGILIAAGIGLFMTGPTRVFYWLHTHIFPADHQWFFYYQESLMTTLMKAPDLFGFITAIWVALGVCLMTTTLVISRKQLTS